MKKLFFLAMFLFSLALSTKSQVPSYIPKNGLIAWYPFNGNANDLSGSNLHGNVIGATLTTDRNGITNAAYSFDTLQQILVPNSETKNIFPITISLWYNASAYAVNGSSNLFSKYVSASWDGYQIEFNDSRNVPNLGTTENHGFATPAWYVRSLNDRLIGYYNEPAFLQPNVNLNTWYHYVFVVDLNGGKIYVNGELISSHNWSGAPGACTNNFLWKIGGQYGDSYYFKGKIDDIGIWNRALTQEEIKGLYKSCTVGLSINPVTVNINTNSNATFNASTLFPASSFQWQTNPLNVGWQNVPNNSTYSGATTNSLKVNNVKVANHLQQFRIIASGANCIDTSAVATISIKDTCIVTNLIAVTDTLKINTIISGLAAPNNVNTIKIFPNPASDHITIDFGKFTLMSGYKIRITNAAGLIVYTSSISQQTSYIDLSSWSGKGIYFVQIIDKQNKIVENKKIIIQ